MNAFSVPVVTPDTDIWRAADLMLKRYRDKPFEESAARADELAAGIPARHDIETLVGLDELIEEETVEDKKSGNR